MKHILSYFGSKRALAVFLAMLLAFLFLRSFQMRERLVFGWDQVRDAWVMKDIVVDHRFPLAGPTVRGNTVLGPAYYYLLLPFYAAAGLHPIGASVFTVFAAVLTIFVLFHVARDLFSVRTALIATFIYTVSAVVLISDRIPWNVSLLPMDALLVFWLAVKSARRVRYLPWLALAAGFGFHLHFTAVFYAGILPFLIPFIVKQKQWLKYAGIAVLVFIATFIPYLVYLSREYAGARAGTSGFFEATFIGFHLRRVMQLKNDAFIQVEELLFFRQLRWLSAVVPFLFALVYWLKKKHTGLPVAVLAVVWFIVPWMVMSVYGAEISDYYFVITRPVAVLAAAYLLDALLSVRGFLVWVAVLLSLGYYAYWNVRAFVERNPTDFLQSEQKARSVADHAGYIAFQEGVPESYLFNLFTKWTHLGK